MFVFYCHTTSGRQLAIDLGVAHYTFSRHSLRHRCHNGDLFPCYVNWGCTPHKLTAIPRLPNTHVMNANISTATSKRTTLHLLHEAGIPAPELLLEWKPGLKGRWLARLDYLSGGEGIEILQEGQEPAQRYHFLTKYIAKDYEVRVHVFNGKVILTQFKYVPSGSGVLIRNHAVGATFSAKPLETHLNAAQCDVVRDIAIRTVAVLGLQFGAVDIIISKKGRAFVLEMNTAPGLSTESGTYQAYLAAFQSVKKEG